MPSIFTTSIHTQFATAFCFNLWQRQIIGSLQMRNLLQSIERTALSPQQERVRKLVKDFLKQRTNHYDNVPEVDQLSDSKDENWEESEAPAASIATGLDWRKYILIKGKPGTGKSHAIKVVIEESLEEEYTVCCATPTGILTSSYRAQFIEDSFYCDTIHTMFKYPVLKEEKPMVNWELGQFNVLIIDELSMVPQKIFMHIASTFQQLHVRPVVVLCGDQQQQQPITTVEGKTRQTERILNSRDFYKQCVVVDFLEQHRCRDLKFQEYLNYLRYYKPSKAFLRELFKDRTLCRGNEPSQEQLRSILLENSESLVLTVSRKAAQRVNDIAVHAIFMGKTAFASVQMDNTESQMVLFKGMRVIITQNRDKKNGVINGQNDEVVNYELGTILLKLPNSHVVAIHTVTEIAEDGTNRVFYPIVPAYATTICKIQGQTLHKVVIWLDCPYVPRGTAYVALSRLRTLEDLSFMVYGNSEQFLPVEMLKE